MQPMPKKSLGQHWLSDPDILSVIVDAAELDVNNTVLEIGPGLGTLSKVLAARAGQVIAIELDDALFERLESQQIAKNLQFVKGSILEYDLTSLPAGYKIVANIPYYLTSNLIRTLSESVNPPQTAVILVQKEVAQRVAAQPGDMSILSVTAQYYWDVSLGIEVAAKFFLPPPKVDSQVLVMHRRKAQLFPDVDDKAFFRLVKAGFSQRRKTLLNSLSGGLQLGKEEISELLSRAGIPPTARAQTLSLDDWYSIYQALQENPKA